MQFDHNDLLNILNDLLFVHDDFFFVQNDMPFEDNEQKNKHIRQFRRSILAYVLHNGFSTNIILDVDLFRMHTLGKQSYYALGGLRTVYVSVSATSFQMQMFAYVFCTSNLPS